MPRCPPRSQQLVRLNKNGAQVCHRMLGQTLETLVRVESDSLHMTSVEVCVPGALSISGVSLTWCMATTATSSHCDQQPRQHIYMLICCGSDPEQVRYLFCGIHPLLHNFHCGLYGMFHGGHLATCSCSHCDVWQLPASVVVVSA